jgi:hypothetical protein
MRRIPSAILRIFPKRGARACSPLGEAGDLPEDALDAAAEAELEDVAA